MISYHLLPFDKTAPTSIVSWFFKVQGGEGIRMPAGFSMIFSCRLWRNNSPYSEAVYYITRSFLDQVLLRIFVSTLTFASVNKIPLCYQIKETSLADLISAWCYLFVKISPKQIWTFAFFLINQFDGEGKYSKHFITTDTDKSSWQCWKCTTASLLYCVKRGKFSQRKDNKKEFKSCSLFCCDCSILSRVRSISFRPYI